MSTKRVQIPAWYHEILTIAQCQYMQEMFDGKNYQQIADDHAVLPSTVSRTVSRARARIRQYRREMMPAQIGVDVDGLPVYDREVIL